MTIQRKWRRSWKMWLACLLLAGQAGLGYAAETMELTLEESVNLALRSNPTIKMAINDKAVAEYGIKTAKGALLPTLAYQHSDVRGNSSSSSEIKNTFDNKFTLSWKLYSFGQLEGQVGAAKANFKSADIGVAKAAEQIKLDATNGFYSVLQTRNLVVVGQESVDQLDAHLKNVQAQYGVGTVAKSDVLRSEVQLANAQQDLIKAKNNNDLAIASLNNVIGLPHDTKLEVKEQLKYEAYDKTLEDCIAYSLKNRPEVLQVGFAVESAKESKRSADAGHSPVISLQGVNDWNSNTFPGDDNRNWYVGAFLNWNAFDSGVVNAKKGQAEESLAKALQQEKQTKDLVQLEVRQAYLSLREAEKRIDTSKVAVTKADEDFKIAQVRYMAGVGTNIDVIDAQVALTQAKTNYYQALYDYNTNRAKLEKAMGIAVELKIAK